MCGIAGLFHHGNDSRVDTEDLVAMRAALRHRGPDSEGLYIHQARLCGLASTRLSIRDLSSAGDQPFVDAASGVAVVFNGEIYNADAFRAELAATGVAFHSSCDTEVLLRLYCERGEAFVDELNGIFSIAIWDERRAMLILVRDPLGVKPLYYFDHEGTFGFASEPKALLRLAQVPRSLNEAAIASYLTFACVPAPHTLFRHVFKVPSATLLRVAAGRAVEKIRYWTPIAPELIRELSSATEASCVERVRSIFSHAVGAQLVGDVCATCSLSGGVDSSSVASLMSAFSQQRMTYFTIGFGEKWGQYNEYAYARNAARHAHADLVELCATPEATLKFLADDFAETFDDPNADPVSGLAFALAREMHRQGFKVALSGEGADEIFVGYERYLAELSAWRAAQSSAGASPDAWFWGLGIAFRPESMMRVLNPSFAEAHFDPVRHAEPIVRAHRDALSCLDRTDLCRRLSYIELQVRLPELLLMRVDKASMAHAVEYRVPFLDKTLVELAFAIPAAIKVKDGRAKSVLKRAAENWIPAENINRAKMGFALPISDWLRDSRLCAQFVDLIAHSELIRSDIVQPCAVDKLFAEHQAGVADRHFEIWTLLTLSRWFERWQG